MTDMQRVLIVAVIVLVGLLVYLLQPILAPFLLAALLAYLGDPAADKFEARGLSRTWSVVLVFTLFTSVFLILMAIAVPLVAKQVGILAERIPQWLESLQAIVAPFLKERFDLSKDNLPLAQIGEALRANLSSATGVVSVLWTQVSTSGLALIGFIANVFLVPVVTFYLLRDWDVLIEHIHDLLPRSIEGTTVKLAKECDEILAAFLRGQLSVMLALGCVYSIGLWLVGLEMALLLGLLAGLASIVPYLGFIVGIIAASIAAYFQFGELFPLIGVAVVFMVGQILEGVVLTPLLVGDRIGLHPVAVIFAVLAGGQLFGFVGVLLSLPVAAVLMVFLRHAHHNYKSSGFYGSQREQVSDES